MSQIRPVGFTQAAVFQTQTSKFNLGAQAVCTLQPQIELFFEYNL